MIRYLNYGRTAITYLTVGALSGVAISHPGGVIHIEARDSGAIARPVYHAAELERALDNRIVLGEPFETVELEFSATAASAVVMGVSAVLTG